MKHEMFSRKNLIGKQDLEFILGFRLTPLRSAILCVASFASLILPRAEDLLFTEPFTLALTALTLASAGLTTAGAIKAGKAAKEAATPTDAEIALQEDAESIITSVDRAATDTAISQGAVPIASAIAGQQQEIAQQTLGGTGGGGVPGGVSGRAAALQRNLARQGSEGIADVALGAQRTAEEKGLMAAERKTAALGDVASLSRTRKGQALQAQIASSQGLQQGGTELAKVAGTGILNRAARA